MSTDNKGIYFTQLTLKNVRCFGDEAVLKLSNDNGEWTRWNVILGDNGTGKTTLLQCLAGMELRLVNNKEILKTFNIETNETEDLSDDGDWYPKLFLNTAYSFAALNNENNFKEGSQGYDSIKSIAIGELIESQTLQKERLAFGHRYNSKKINWGDPLKINLHDESFHNLFIVGYGANRRISFRMLSEKELDTENSATLFDDDAKLINTEEWLLQLEFAASRKSELQDMAIKRRDLIFESLKNILPDVAEIRFKDSVNIDKPVPRLEFKTPYGWVGVEQLSFGYKTMVAWMIDVAARMFKQYPNSPNPLSEPVVILVDEIDLHLHPKWQRQIFSFLETRFPLAQFIVTAHSPLIVQSAPKDANIVVLKKVQVVDEYVVKIDNDVESVRSWRVDQIMASDIFGVEGSRNPEIENNIIERRNLILKKELTDAEKSRLAELNEIVNSIPFADSKQDIQAMDIIRKAADYLKTQQK